MRRRRLAYCAGVRTYGGKTAEERRAERRARLIDAAIDLFAEQGYVATSARAVLLKAGLKERYFAENFSGMEELLAAVHDHIHDASFAATLRAMDPAAEPEVQLRQMIAAEVGRLESDPGRFAINLLQALGAGPVVHEHRRRALLQYADLIASLLPEPPAGSPIDRETLAIALTTGINGMFIDFLTGALRLTPGQLVDHAVLLLRGTLHEVARYGADQHAHVLEAVAARAGAQSSSQANGGLCMRIACIIHH
jgi:AcrR family transcriptional regulator